VAGIIFFRVPFLGRQRFGGIKERKLSQESFKAMFLREPIDLYQLENMEIHFDRDDGGKRVVSRCEGYNSSIAMEGWLKCHRG
jgi:hypothetical protein